MAIVLTAAYDDDYQCYQRDKGRKKNLNPIRLVGTVTGLSDNPHKFQYRVVGVDAGTISGNTDTSPTVVTLSGLALPVNDHGTFKVKITGSNSTPSINGDHVATWLTATTFSIPVAVTVAGTAGSVQLVHKDWVTLGQLPGDGTFDFYADNIPQGGWYQWELRTYNPIVGTAIESFVSTNQWCVGFGVGIYGQSNGVQMFTVVSAPTVNARTAVYTGGAWGLPTTEGVATLLAGLRLALVNAGDDVPVFAINLSVSGSALIEEADWASLGFWTGPVLRAAVKAVGVAAMHPDANTGKVDLEHAIWFQGEAEASASNLALDPDYFYCTEEKYRTAFFDLWNNLLSLDFTFHGSKGTIAQMGQIEQNKTTFVDDTLILSLPAVREAEVRICDQDSRWNLCQLMDVVKGVDGLHYAAAGFEVVGERLSYAVRLALGIAPTVNLGGNFNNVPFSKGPQITSAKFITPDTVRFKVQHENGTTISTVATITNISIANPTVVTITGATCPAESTFDVVIAGSDSTPVIDGARVATRLSATTFSVPVNVTVGGSAGTVPVRSAPDNAAMLFQAQTWSKKCHATAVSVPSVDEIDVTFALAELPVEGWVGIGYCNFSHPVIALMIKDENGVPLQPSASAGRKRQQALDGMDLTPAYPWSPTRPQGMPEVYPLQNEAVVVAGTANTLDVTVGDGSIIEIGDLICAFDSGVGYTGLRRVIAKTGDQVTVDRNWDITPTALYTYRFTGTAILPGATGHNAQGLIAAQCGIAAGRGAPAVLPVA